MQSVTLLHAGFDTACVRSLRLRFLPPLVFINFVAHMGDAVINYFDKQQEGACGVLLVDKIMIGHYCSG